ncbi:MAG: hypothetical protein VKO64_10225 [Candidatus Sericytochromatia bacterium]|nr:hypothetical protein [Candidatus Sericytochromatia bacterium]
MVPAGSPDEEARTPPGPGGGLEGARTTVEERQALLAAFTDEPGEGEGGGLGLLSALEGAFPEGGAAIPTLDRFLLDGEAPARSSEDFTSPEPQAATAATVASPQASPMTDAAPPAAAHVPDSPGNVGAVTVEEAPPEADLSAMAGLYEALGDALDSLGIEDDHPIREGIPEPPTPVFVGEGDDPWSELESPAEPEVDPTIDWPALPVGMGRMADDLWMIPGGDASLRVCMPTAVRRALDPREPVETRRGLLMGRVSPARDLHGSPRVDVTILAAVPLTDGTDGPGLRQEARRVLQGLLQTGAQHPGTALVPVGTYVMRPGGGLVRDDGGLHEALMPHAWQTCLVVDDVKAEAVLLQRTVGRMPRTPTRGEPVFDPATGGLIRGARRPWHRAVSRSVRDFMAPADRRQGAALALVALLTTLWIHRPQTFALALVGSTPVLTWTSREEPLALYGCLRPECRSGDRRRLGMVPPGADHLPLPKPLLGKDPPSSRVWYRLAELDRDGQPVAWSRALPFDWPAEKAFKSVEGEMELSLDRQTLSLGLRNPEPHLAGIWVIRENLGPGGEHVRLGEGRRLRLRLGQPLQDHVAADGIYRYLMLPQDRLGVLGQPWDTAAVGLRARPPWDAWGR